MKNKPVGIGARAPKALEHKTCRFHPTGCIDDGAHPMSATSRHAEIPEKFIVTQVGGEKSTVTKYEAPTDESWNWELNSFWYKQFENDYPNSLKQFREFIASLLKKEREKYLVEESATFNFARNLGVIDGKSEAFSLVRKSIEGLKTDEKRLYFFGDWVAETHNEKMLVNAVLKELLSTLEGK